MGISSLFFKKGVKAKLDSVAIRDGQILYTTDEGTFYIDVGSERK